MRASKGKLDRFRPFSAMAQNNGILFLESCGYDYENKIDHDNEFIYRELEVFDGKRKSGEMGHDRMLSCINLLNSVEHCVRISTVNTEPSIVYLR